MKTATFENSVNVLVNSFIKGTLKFKDCTACAVGNLMSAGGYKFKGSHNDGITEQWLKKIISTERGYPFAFKYVKEIADEQIEASGYTTSELNKIELAFEGGAHIDGSVDEKQFNGLMAVVDVLADIHGISFEQKSVAKAMFVKETTQP